MSMRRALLRLTLVAAAIAVSSCGGDRLTPLEPTDPGGTVLTAHQCRIDPEAVRQAARTDGRLRLGSEVCQLEDPCPECDGLYVPGWDNYSCFWNASLWDPDGDVADNGCENALASAFAPELVAARDCNYDVKLRRQGGEYYFAAQRVTGGDGLPLMRIAYLPAYYLDCGTPRDQLSKCFDFLGVDFCDGHTGDSEFIMVDARFSDASEHWETQRVFLSAHCGAFTGFACRWWTTSQFAWVESRRLGAPVVWQAEGKHAHYPSLVACNGGALGMDECNFNSARHRIPVVYGQQNIGSRARPLRDCVAPFWPSDMTVPTSTECLWSRGTRVTFDGWQGYTRNGGSALYEEHLARYAGF